MKYICIASVIVLMAGCTTTSRMNAADLNQFQIDCDRRDEQMAFLQRQMPTKNEQLINGMRMTSPVGTAMSLVDGTYQEERATFDRRQQAIARVIMHQIRQNCPVQTAKPQGCIQINEQLPAGNSQGQRCYINGSTKPAIDKWEISN